MTVKLEDEFELGIVRAKDFEEEPTCPHCETTGLDDNVLTYIDTKDLTGHVGLCHNCDKPYLVVEYPVLIFSDPVYTKWSLKHK